jgi:ADP-ribose pyrophosphatase YjhB (NUDIX family)
MKELNFTFDKNRIKSRLFPYNSPDRINFEDKNFIKGAVLFLIQINPNKPYNLVLIKRTARKNDKHSGEMSFPGGKFDHLLDSNYQDTAIRETEEEIGISSDDIQILGSFDDHITPKMFIISPFVAVINKNQSMIKEEKEVDEIVKIPITFFTEKKNYRERTYTLHGNNIAVGKYVYIINDNNENQKRKYTIFGATSHLIVTFLDIVYDIKLMKKGCRRLECGDFEERIRKTP